MQGKNWYYEINDYCNTLSEAYNVPLIKVAAIMSALSPNNTFKSNCLSLERFLRTKGDCKVTCFNRQKLKAQNILDSENLEYDTILNMLGKGKKTRAFFDNIYQPETSQAVTVDRWQIRWGKSLGLIPEKGVLTDKRYDILANAVREYAEELNIKPHQFQAVTWTQIRGKEY